MIWHGVLLSPSLGFPTVCWKTGGLNFFPRKAYCAYYKPRQRRKTRPRCALHHSWNCTNIIDRELSHTVCSHIPEYETFLLLHQSCRYQLSNTPPLHFFFTPCMQRFTNPHLVVRCMPTSSSKFLFEGTGSSQAPRRSQLSDTDLQYTASHSLPSAHRPQQPKARCKK